MGTVKFAMILSGFFLSMNITFEINLLIFYPPISQISNRYASSNANANGDVRFENSQIGRLLSLRTM